MNALEEFLYNLGLMCETAEKLENAEPEYLYMSHKAYDNLCRVMRKWGKKEKPVGVIGLRIVIVYLLEVAEFDTYFGGDIIITADAPEDMLDEYEGNIICVFPGGESNLEE